MTRLFFLISLLFAATSALAANIIEKNVQYRPDSPDEYAADRCRVDIVRPENAENAPVIVWFHGGGLTTGSKDLRPEILDKGYVVISANYRLMPRVPIDSCIADAAAAVAWAAQNARRLGGDPKKNRG